MRFDEYYLTESAGTFYHGSPYSFDRFDMNKVGTGDGLNKYGFGLYFADNKDLAAYYATENFLSKNKKHSGMNMYEVKIRGLEDFYPWDESIPEHIYMNIADRLQQNGYEDDAQTMRDELDGYNETWTMDQTYSILRDTIGGDKQASEFLYGLGVNGVISDDIQGRGKIFVAFSDEIVKMIRSWRLGEEDNEI